MHDFSDQELDRLAREAAENYDASRGPISWDSLRQELDKAMPAAKSKDRRKFFWLFLVALLILGGVSYIYWSGNGSKLQGGKSETAKSGTQLSPNSDNTAISVPDKNAQSTPPGNSKDNESTPEDKNANDKNPTNSSNPAAQSKTKSPGKSDFAASIPNSGAALSGGPTRSSFESKSKALNSKTGTNRSKANKSGLNQNLAVGELAVANQPSADYQSLDPLNVKTSFADPLRLPNQSVRSHSNALSNIPASPAVAKKINPSTKQPQKGPEFSLIYAPDWSNVKFTGSGEVGYNFGVLLGYNFSSRWSIETGLIYTQKNYVSSGENFKFPPNYYYGNLVKAEGYCNMFDIPINVRYNVISTNTQKVFLSAGLSSYLMNKEHYKFHCTSGGNYWPSWYTNYDNNNYLFSIANFSFGYEYAFSRHFSLLGEPYFKFALSDIGTGNIKLNSMGMYLGIKYKPSLGKAQGTTIK